MSKVSTDPIADMLARIRNANAVNIMDITLPHSAIKESIAKVLADNNFIVSVATTKGEIKNSKQLTLALSTSQQSPKITSIKRISSPGRRIYISYKDIPRIKRGRGIVILSTAKGVMEGEQARAKQIGGEVICEVY